jgi:methylmalonyl-CoA/ethylmalonyl-CoA epimerase
MSDLDRESRPDVAYAGQEPLGGSDREQKGTPMPGPQLEIKKLNHINQVLSDYDGAIDFYRRVFGAKLTFDGRQQFGPYNNCILYIGPVIIELFSPCDETGLGRLIARYGDTWQGVEFLTPNLDDSIAAVNARNLRIVDHNPGKWFFLLPSECHGLCLEIVDPVGGVFAEDQGETNPFGITGLKNLSVAVRDVDAAVAFYADLVAGAHETYRDERPNVGAVAVGMNFGPETVEFLAPTGPGAISDYLDRYRQQIRGISFRVKDLGAVKEHLAASGLPRIEGDEPGSIAIPPEHNYGVLYQFSD